MPPPDPYGQPVDPSQQGWGAPPPSGPMPAQGGGGSNTTGLIVLAVIVVLGAIGAGAFFLLSGDDEDSGDPEGVVTSYLSAANEGDCDAAGEIVTDELQSTFTDCGVAPSAEEQVEIRGVNVTGESDSGATVVADLTSQLQGEFQMTFQLSDTDGSLIITDLEVGGAEGSSDGGGGQAQPEGGGGEAPEGGTGGAAPEGGTDPGAGAPPETDDGSSGGPSDPSGGGDSSGVAPGAAAPIPSGSPDDCLGSGGCEQYLQPCHDGDMAACDDLWGATDVGSSYENYAETCGGRSTELLHADCEATYGPQV